MRKPQSMRALEALGRVRLSENFFMRDFLHSEIASFYGIANIPDDPDLAIEAGSRLCTECLEPLYAKFGRISIRSAYRSPAVNDFGNKHNLNCGSNESNYAGHIWDRRDAAARSAPARRSSSTPSSPTSNGPAIGKRWPGGSTTTCPTTTSSSSRNSRRSTMAGRTCRPAASTPTSRRGSGWLVKRNGPNARGDHSAEYAEWLATITPGP